MVQEKKIIFAAAWCILIYNISIAKAMSDADRAISLVFDFPKVKTFVGEMKAKRQKVGGMAEKQSPCLFNVRIYEDHPDHAATFGFFNADVCKGTVVEE